MLFFQKGGNTNEEAEEAREVVIRRRNAADRLDRDQRRRTTRPTNHKWADMHGNQGVF